MMNRPTRHPRILFIAFLFLSLWIGLVPFCGQQELAAQNVESKQTSNDAETQTENNGPVQWGLLFDLSIAEVQAFWCVISTIICYFLVVIIGTVSYRFSTSIIGIYRPYEMLLLNQGRLKLQDVLDYHAQYHWGTYAAGAISMVLVSVTLVVTGVKGVELSAADKVIQVFAVGCMTIAAIALCFADLVHTNSQTPIIPIRKRFNLIDFSVQFGSLGTMLMITSVLFFAAMIDFYVTALCCVVYIVVLMIVFYKRRIPKDEFFEYFEIFSTEHWNPVDHDIIREHASPNRHDLSAGNIPYRETSKRALAIYCWCVDAADGKTDEALFEALQRYLHIAPREHNLALREFEERKTQLELITKEAEQLLGEEDAKTLFAYLENRRWPTFVDK